MVHPADRAKMPIYLTTIRQSRHSGKARKTRTKPLRSGESWQNWETQSGHVYLEEGYYKIRLLVRQGEHNLNWFHLVNTTGMDDEIFIAKKFTVYPNPGDDFVTLNISSEIREQHTISILDTNGRVMDTFGVYEPDYTINTSGY
jgi:hypothetical protein